MGLQWDRIWGAAPRMGVTKLAQNGSIVISTDSELAQKETAPDSAPQRSSLHSSNLSPPLLVLSPRTAAHRAVMLSRAHLVNANQENPTAAPYTKGAAPIHQQHPSKTPIATRPPLGGGTTTTTGGKAWLTGGKGLATGARGTGKALGVKDGNSRMPTR